MFSSPRLAFAVAMIVLTWTTCARAGWSIEQVATGNGWKVQQRAGHGGAGDEDNYE